MLDLRLLNKEQYKAVTSTTQNLRIIAGAGSGKTRVLSFRIAYLIEHFNLEPYQILAITFTNKVAKEMKERTISLLPYINAKDLNIFTFHSWCARFLRREIDCIDFPKSFTIIDDADQLKILKDIAEDRGYKKSDDIVKYALNFISKYKTEGLLPSDINPKELLKAFDKTALEFFKEYEKYKNENYFLDFDDLLVYSVRILKEFPEIRKKYAFRYRSILVDEFQDTNNLQYELIKLLSTVETKIFVVGDPDQTIYTWRGANQKIILDIDQVYPDMETVILNQNYRSTDCILTAANKLISYNKDRYKKDLFTNNKKNEPIVVKMFHTKEKEGDFVAKTIKELKRTTPNFKYNDVAILYRSSYLSFKIESNLLKNNIPYVVYGGIRFFSRAEIKDCLAFFRLILNEDDDFSFLRIINVPKRGIGDKTIENLKSEAKDLNLSLINYLKKIHLYKSKVKGQIVNLLMDLISNLDKTREKIKIAKKTEIAGILNDFIKDIGYKDYLAQIKNEKEEDRLENVQELIEDITSYFKNDEEASLNGYLENVTLLSAQDEITDKDVVSLMTVHTAKGLEFPYVFLIGFSDETFPSLKSLLERKGEEEERRLAYVAFTRAKEKLYITCNGEYSYATGQNQTPSRFIKEAELNIQRNENILFSGFNSKEPKYPTYRYGYDYVKPRSTFTYKDFQKEDSDVVEIRPKNDIKWNLNDRCYHETFKSGTVIDINDDVLTIEFDDYGRKKISGTHIKLKKI